MSHCTKMIIYNCIASLRDGYRQLYGEQSPEYIDLLEQLAPIVLEHLATSDAPYHNLEHTILVLEAGQEIIEGKQRQEGTVSCQDWLQFILALMCHDIGFVKGICAADRPSEHCYTTGQAGATVTLAPNATCASLAPYHVDRGQQFVQELLANQTLVEAVSIQQMIELTRFP
ncbi:MAG: metal-dependent phosphohydrolase, partial [Synechococcales bacterium]|nr:metal-dependent phosphohydrolase [Synechococcales bacterium]